MENNMEFTKYKRGTVWFYTENIDKHKLSPKNSIESGSRPCIIISNDKFNSFSPVVNVLMLSGSIKPSLSHVTMNVVGDNNIYSNNKFRMKAASDIQCEQLKTVNIKDLTEYLGCVSQDIMDRIDEKISFQLNVQTNSKLAVNKLKEFIDKYIEISLNKMGSSVNSRDIINELKDNLDNILKSKHNPEPTKELAEEREQEEKKSQQQLKPDIKSETKQNPVNITTKEIIKNIVTEKDTNKVARTNKFKKQSKNLRYTDEDIKFFMSNYPANRELLAKKYNKNNSELSKLFYYFKHKNPDRKEGV